QTLQHPGQTPPLAPASIKSGLFPWSFLCITEFWRLNPNENKTKRGAEDKSGNSRVHNGLPTLPGENSFPISHPSLPSEIPQLEVEDLQAGVQNPLSSQSGSCSQ
ncbi:unnamed protein product, partial [Coccothraustes coccothraustes]